jgi:hypothetical protein
VLSDLEKALLDFEGQWWKSQAVKDEAMWEIFRLTPTSYYQHVRAIVKRPEAEMYAPRVVRRWSARLR